MRRARTLTVILLLAGLAAWIRSLDQDQPTGRKADMVRCGSANAAISTLRTIASAHARGRERGLVDRDGDGRPEFAHVAELARDRPIADEGNAIEPRFLQAAFASTLRSAHGKTVERQGYDFAMALPGAPAGGRVPPVGGPLAGEDAPALDAALCAELWCAYAWSVEVGRSGHYALFISQEGLVLGCDAAEDGTRAAYEGLDAPPPFDAAHAAPGDLSSTPFGANGGVARDGRRWSAMDSVPMQPPAR